MATEENNGAVTTEILENDYRCILPEISENEGLFQTTKWTIFFYDNENMENVYVFSDDTVEKLKTKIYESSGVPVAYQLIIFQDNVLIDKDRLCEVGLEDFSIVNLCVLSRDIKIHICLNGETSSLEVSSNDTVKELKMKILLNLKVPIYRQNIYLRGKLFIHGDDKRLTDCGIQNDSTLRIDVQNPEETEMLAEKCILRELKYLKKYSAEEFSAGPINDDMFHWEAQIMGPPDSPYESGVFCLDIEIPRDYPMTPPKLRFITKIYHPNIDSNGRVCVDILENKWSIHFTISAVLFSIWSLLNDPNPDESFNPDMSLLFKNNRTKYNSNVRNWTRKYAM